MSVNQPAMILSIPLYVYAVLTNRRLLAFLCIALNSLCAAAQTPGAAVTNADDKVQQYNQQAAAMLNAGNPDEALPFIKLALEQKQNPVSYHYLCRIHTLEQDWDEAIKDGEKAMQLDSNYSAVYGELLYCYINVGNLNKAESIKKLIVNSNTSNENVELLKSLDEALANNARSRSFIALFLLVLGAVVFLPLMKASKPTAVNCHAQRELRASEALLLSAAVSGAFWMLFFACSRWIWSFNPHLPASLYTPVIKVFIHEHDGIESFALYILMFASMTVTFGSALLLPRFRSNPKVHFAVSAGLFLASAYYFYRVGFFPPMPDNGVEGTSQGPIILGILTFLSVCGYCLYNRFALIIKGIFVVLMAYVCLVMILPTNPVDLSFVLYPALRMENGAKLQAIFVQYDLFLSLLALAWLKLHYSPETFAYLGQVSFFVFFLACFFFADPFFKVRKLSVLFIIALVITRYYSIWEVGVGFFQVSPLRLDLWILPLLAAYWKSAYHWLVGLSLGLLVIFHRTLGLIYLVSYVELAIVLLILDSAPCIASKQFNGSALRTLCVKHLRLNSINLIMIGASIGLCFIVSRELVPSSALLYGKLGAFMTRISPFSFYWYVPVICGLASVLLYRFRDKLGQRYTVTSIFILLLSIGQSMYFFGRSHENNILNVSGLLMLVVFIAFDICICQCPEPVTLSQSLPSTGRQVVDAHRMRVASFWRQVVLLSMPFGFIFLLGYYYSGRIIEKCSLQYSNLRKGQFVCPLPPMGIDIDAVKQITRNGSRVFVLDWDSDFWYYYYGHYAPLGYSNPLESWIYKKDLIAFTQDLLNRHYYIVYNAKKYAAIADYIPYLHYNQIYEHGQMAALYKADNKMLLADTTPSLFHIASEGTVPRNGMDFADLELAGDFCVEVIFRALAVPPRTVSLLNKLSRVNQLKGWVLQTIPSAPGQYVFAFANGKAMPAASFHLEDDRWHYLAIVVNKELMSIYDNGTLVSRVDSGGLPVINNDVPLTIGNSSNRDAHFDGYIREVKISNGNVQEAEIIRLGQRLNAELNKR